MWPFQSSIPDRTEPCHVIDSTVNRVLERYEAAALELGYNGTPDAEADQRAGEALDAARAELTLLEPRANGFATATVADRQHQLQQLLDLRAMPAPVVPQLVAGNPSSAWRFDWRRCLGWIVLSALAGCVLASIGYSRWHPFAALVCVAVLLVFGPWHLSGHLATAAAAARRALAWVAFAIHAAWLNHRIASAKRQVIAAALRQGLADRWVQQRLDLIRHRMAVQRARAGQAAKIIASQYVVNPEENQRESFLHPLPIRRP
jgi:hypothetical protein